jgi:hypothetical protein
MLMRLEQKRSTYDDMSMNVRFAYDQRSADLVHVQIVQNMIHNKYLCGRTLHTCELTNFC